ncbi:MAG TPA: DUF502 domain-containing protein [Tepidisphaeraceae bacterium]|nr:DUF502 domain-containing protein [Tepidisphaeraceae bacterium]
MSPAQKHLRNTFLAGIFAAIPLAVTVFVIVYVERVTREPVAKLTRVNIPFVGVLLAVALIYLIGLGVSSLVGKWLLGLVDKLLLRVPVLKELYQAWKHVSLTPGGKEGIYAKVCLIPGDGAADAHLLGFTSGDPLPGDGATLAVFVPNVPNPVVGRIYFVRRERCQILDTTVEEAFKLILSSGNYAPEQLRIARGQPVAVG